MPAGQLSNFLHVREESRPEGHHGRHRVRGRQRHSLSRCTIVFGLDLWEEWRMGSEMIVSALVCSFPLRLL